MIRDMEDARLLEIIEAGWSMVQRIAGRSDKEGTRSITRLRLR